MSNLANNFHLSIRSLYHLEICSSSLFAEVFYFFIFFSLLPLHSLALSLGLMSINFPEQFYCSTCLHISSLGASIYCSNLHEYKKKMQGKLGLDLNLLYLNLYFGNCQFPCSCCLSPSGYASSLTICAELYNLHECRK